MSQREANLVCLRDVLEHLASTQKQLEWTEDRQTLQILTENMLRDLERCTRLCESLRQRAGIKVRV